MGIIRTKNQGLLKADIFKQSNNNDMKIKTRVTLVEQLGDDPYYSVQAWLPMDAYWITYRIFSFKEGGSRTKEETEALALEFAKQLESGTPKTETIIYETDK